MTKKEILLQCELAYQEKFLELNNLKIGDEVECSFFPNLGTAKQSYTTCVIGKGIIVKTDDGIFVKSNDKYKKSSTKKMYPNRPLNTKTYWAYEDTYLLSKLEFIKINYE